MQLVNRHFNQLGKAGIALSLAVLVLALNAMAAFPGLHELVHRDADEPGHQCVVTLFAHGHVDAAAVDAAVVAQTIWFQAASRHTVSAFAPAIEQLPAGRAPPASVSSLV